ncbi:Retrovirus-related Pol polyprotein from transposon TNT 1-94 [Anthophora plagiata]
MENQTWTLVPRPNNKKVLSNRWVFKTKINQNGEIEKYKARLVARGHTQQYGIDYEDVFAPVARYEIIRALLAASVNEEMYVHQMDVISAYVQGELNDEIYMEQPEMFIQNKNKDKVCKLLKPLYGLKQSGREWYRKLDKYIKENNGERTAADPCVYVFGEGIDSVILIIYVDDLILASKNIKVLEEIKLNLMSAFKMVDLGQISNILGINIKRDGPTGKIRLTQKKYIEDLIRRFNMEDAKTAPTPIEPNMKIIKETSPMSEEEKSEMKCRPYRGLIGALVYLANATRPDIAFAASALSKFSSNPRKIHWTMAKRVLRYLKETSNYGITYCKDGESLKAYSDSDWAGDIEDRRSCTGNVLILSGGPISWKSKKQPSVALSTMEAEYAALSEISREVIYIKRLLIHMGFEKYVPKPIKILCDNQSAIKLAKDAVFHKRSKHIDIRYHFTRELIERKEVVIEYVRTDLMIADVFTKSLSRNKHEQCVKMLNIY